MITGKGPSARHEIFYFAENNLAAVRYDDYKYQFITQPGGWLGTKDHPDVPILVNLRLDPFEKMGFIGVDGNRGSYLTLTGSCTSSGASCLSSKSWRSSR